LGTIRQSHTTENQNGEAPKPFSRTNTMQETARVSKFERCKSAYVIFVICAMTVISSPAQTFKTLVNFNGTNGADPQEPLLPSQ
jgi:hypothetical protein